jgi:hypothetical protein
VSDYADRMARTLIADHERFMSRQAREDALLSNDDESRAALADWSCERPLLRGVGMVGTSGTNRRYPHATPRTRAHGAAALPPDAAAAERLAAGDVEATVLCYNASDPDNVTVRTVAEIRGSRESAKNRAPQSKASTVVDTARFTVDHDFNN